MELPKIYHAYDCPEDPGIDCSIYPKLTRDSEADACDVNRIVARFEQSGILPSVDREGVFADVADIGDYRTALERVSRAQEVFATFDARIRKRFNNDPAEFLDFMSNPANEDEAIELGIVKAKPVEQLVVTAPVAPAKPGA